MLKISNIKIPIKHNKEDILTAAAEILGVNKYVDDLVEGAIRLMATGDDFIGPVNIGNPGEFTMLELAEKVLKLTGSSSKIIHMPLPADDPLQRKPDISLAKQKLDWEPHIPLEEGLVKTINYFKTIVK